jgi:rhamnosyltransferase
MQPRPEISIVIRCCNEEKYIGRLLSGIQKQSRRDVEIIVVDSGSTDATVAIASQFPVKLVSIRPEDFSFGYSLNRGCAVATGDFLVFASAHVYPVYEDWLDRLLEPFSDETVGLCYGKQRGNESTRYSEHQVFAKWFPETSDLSQTHPFCNNANAAIRHSLWKQFPYDETLTGLEDLAWAKQALSAGHRIAYVAEAEVIHVHEETAPKVFNRYRREAIALKAIFPDERLTVVDALRLFIGNLASDYYHAWRDRALFKNLASIPLFRLMQFSGSHSGFRHRGPVSGHLKQVFYYPRSRARPSGKSDGKRDPIDYSSH